MVVSDNLSTLRAFLSPQEWGQYPKEALMAEDLFYTTAAALCRYVNWGVTGGELKPYLKRGRASAET